MSDPALNSLKIIQGYCCKSGPELLSLIMRSWPLEACQVTEYIRQPFLMMAVQLVTAMRSVACNHLMETQMSRDLGKANSSLQNQPAKHPWKQDWQQLQTVSRTDSLYNPGSRLCCYSSSWHEALTLEQIRLWEVHRSGSLGHAHVTSRLW